MTHTPHFNQQGEAHMVDVSAKAVTERVAVAEGYILMLPETLQRIMQGEHRKGDVLAVARIAGIMASKKTADVIPLCHPLPLSHVEVQLHPQPHTNRVHCITTVKTTGQTGVEMEALHATSCALLTIYDMCKGIDRGMVIQAIQLVQKSGGKSGHWQRNHA